MNNDKAKNVLIIVLIILVLACVGYIAYPYVLKSIDKTNTNADINKPTENNVVDKSANDYEAIYAEVKEKYKDYEQLKWLKDSENNKVVTTNYGDKDAKYVIDNGKLYLIVGDKTTQIIEIKGTPKYITNVYYPTDESIYLITEEGEVWYTLDSEDSFVKEKIEEYKIIDISSYRAEGIYQDFYLTDKGVIIGEDMKTFDEIAEDRIIEYQAHAICKDGKLSYNYGENQDNYKYIKDVDGKDIVIKKILFSTESLYVVTDENKFLVVNNENANTYKGTKDKMVKDFLIEQGKESGIYNLNVKFTDNTEITIKDLVFLGIDYVDYYDVTIKQWLDNNGKVLDNKVEKIEIPENIKVNSTMAAINTLVYKNTTEKRVSDLINFYREGGALNTLSIYNDGSLSYEDYSEETTKYVKDAEKNKTFVKYIFPLSIYSEAGYDEYYIAIDKNDNLIIVITSDIWISKDYSETVGKKVKDFNFKQQAGYVPSLEVIFTDGTKVTIDNVYKCYWDVSSKTYKDMVIK